MTVAAPKQRVRRTAGQIFLVPAVLGFATTVGLIAALVGDGMWDIASWLTLSIPIAVMVWFLWVRPRRTNPRPR